MIRHVNSFEINGKHLKVIKTESKSQMRFFLIGLLVLNLSQDILHNFQSNVSTIYLYIMELSIYL